MASHMKGWATPDSANTTDPFAPGYVDPALSKRQRRRAVRQASGEGRGFGWTMLYLLAAALVATLVWVLFGGGV